MTWEQKLQALKALTPAHLEMRAPGDWFVNPYGREVVVGDMLRGDYGNGPSPQEAVEDDWRRIAESGATILLHRDGKRRTVRWNGYMWEEVKR